MLYCHYLFFIILQRQRSCGKGKMNLFDIIGPVMVGPSSSHTAGAVRIGNACRKLLAEDLAEARIGLHGSFLNTGKGHGTDRAIVAGLLGFDVDDSRIPESFDIARDRGIKIKFYPIDLGEDAHPNSAKVDMKGVGGKKLSVIAESVGGGRIRISKIDGLTANFSGELPTLIVHNVDQPGHVAEVTSMLQHKYVNIATMQLYRSRRGGNAVMVLELDKEVPQDGIEWLRKLEGVKKVTYYSPL